PLLEGGTGISHRGDTWQTFPDRHNTPAIKRNSPKSPSPPPSPHRGEGDDWHPIASAWEKLRARPPFPRPCGERVAEGRVRGRPWRRQAPSPPPSPHRGDGDDFFAVRRGVGWLRRSNPRPCGGRV